MGVVTGDLRDLHMFAGQSNLVSFLFFLSFLPFLGGFSDCHSI